MLRTSIVFGYLALLLPAQAVATVSLDVVSGGHPGPYVDSLDGNGFGPGSQFILWTVLHTDQPLDGIEYRLHVNGDADNHKFDLVGYAAGPLSGMEGFFGVPAGSWDGLGGVFSSGFSGQNDAYITRKDGFGLDVIPLGLDAVTPSELIYDSSGPASAANLDGKTVIGCIIEANQNFTVGEYLFTAVGPLGGGVDHAVWTAGGQDPSTGDITEGAGFLLTPEPVSVMSLLAALPFLKRRRS